MAARHHPFANEQAEEVAAAPVRRVKLTIGYLGTHYAGWATQPSDQTRGRPTIQDTLEEALAAVLRHPVRVTAAGRTDAGVHAEGQVVSFDTSSRIPAGSLPRVLEPHLPLDIWAIEGEDVPRTFDARRSAVRRWYRYTIWRGAIPPTEWRGRCLVHAAPLDLQAMRAASPAFLGALDAASLVGGWGRDGRPGKSTVRRVYAADWYEQAEERLLIFEVCADAFLRQMVRTMVGTLLWVGQGKLRPEDVPKLLQAADRRAAGPAAPPGGLTLWKIEYPTATPAIGGGA